MRSVRVYQDFKCCKCKCITQEVELDESLKFYCYCCDEVNYLLSEHLEKILEELLEITANVRAELGLAVQL